MEGADWASLSDKELLERRISILGLKLEGTALEALIHELYDELSAKGLVFHPPTHIGDEWFVPIGISAIFIPFFLVHDRLRALEKLEYVDELMRSLAGSPPVHQPSYRAADYNCLNVKLKTYYARKRKLYEDAYPDFYDADLRQLFAAPVGIKAGAYLRRRRRRILNAVCQWTNEKKFRVNELLARLTRRCDQLGLHVLNDDPQQDFRVSAFITTLVMNYLFTGKFKRTK